jgi:hypothetical protein
LMTMKRKTFSKQNHRPIKSVSWQIVTAFVPQLYYGFHLSSIWNGNRFSDPTKESSLVGLIAFSEAMRDRKSRLRLEDHSSKIICIAGTEDVRKNWYKSTTERSFHFILWTR